MFRKIINDEIVGHFPNSFNNYYEPFCGNDPVLLSVPRQFDAPKDCFLSDSNPNLIRTIIAVRDELETLQIQIERLIALKDKKAVLQHCKENEHVPACYFYANCTYENRSQALSYLGGESALLNRWAKGYSSIVTSGWQWIINHVSEGDVVYLYPPSYQESFKTNGFNKADWVFLKNMCLQFTKKGAHTFVRANGHAGTCQLFECNSDGFIGDKLSDGSFLYNV